MLRHPSLLSPTLTLHKLTGKTYWKTVKTKTKTNKQKKQKKNLIGKLNLEKLQPK